MSAHTMAISSHPCRVVVNIGMLLSLFHEHSDKPTNGSESRPTLPEKSIAFGNKCYLHFHLSILPGPRRGDRAPFH